MSEKQNFFRRAIHTLAGPATVADVFSHLPVLETPRLILRAMRMTDAQDVFMFSKDPIVARHVLWDAHRSIFDSRAYLRAMIHQYREGSPCSYGIILKETNRLVGTIGFMSFSAENGTAEVGYSLARWLWNRGLMTEALSAVLSMGFTCLPLNRIEAMHDTANPASGHVMVKCGMRYEGTMRGKIFNKGRYIDVDLYAILREDWEALHPGEIAKE